MLNVFHQLRRMQSFTKAAERWYISSPDSRWLVAASAPPSPISG
jgi:hypothetical protein